MKTLKIDWKKNAGLVPAIVQDAATLQVLMLGYMDAAALKKTLRTKKVTFFSRSKRRLWTKGPAPLGPPPLPSDPPSYHAGRKKTIR